MECSEPALSKLQNQTYEATSTGDPFVNKKQEVSLFMSFYGNFKDGLHKYMRNFTKKLQYRNKLTTHFLGYICGAENANI